MPTGTPPQAPTTTDAQNSILQSQMQALQAYRQQLEQQGGVGLGLLPYLLQRSGFSYAAKPVENLTIPKTGKPDTDAWLKSTYKGLLGSDPTEAQLANLSPLLKGVTTQAQAQAAQGKVLQAITGTPEGTQAGLTYAGGNVYSASDQFGPLMEKATTGGLTLADMYQQRAQQAMKGELPANPALLQQLRDQQSQFDQGLSAKYGGPGGAALSTPAQQAQYYQNLFQTNALEDSRRADLVNAQNLANAALTGSQASAMQPGSAIGTAFGGASGFGNLAQGYGNPFSNLQGQQMLGYQGQLNAYNANAYQRAGLYGGAGALGGSLLPYLFGSPSQGGGLFSGAGGGLFGGLGSAPATDAGNGLISQGISGIANLFGF